MSDSGSSNRPRKTLTDIFAENNERWSAFFDKLKELPPDQAARVAWRLPPDPFVPEDWKMVNPDPAHQREARADALHEAVLLHGELESQEIFRGEEIETVIATAKRFYEYLWEGK